MNETFFFFRCGNDFPLQFLSIYDCEKSFVRTGFLFQSHLYIFFYISFYIFLLLERFYPRYDIFGNYIYLLCIAGRSLILNGDYFLTWFRFNSYVRLICSNKMSLFHNQLQSSPSKLLLQLTNVYRSYKPLLTDFDENMFFTETF